MRVKGGSFYRCVRVSQVGVMGDRYFWDKYTGFRLVVTLE